MEVNSAGNRTYTRMYKPRKNPARKSCLLINIHGHRLLIEKKGSSRVIGTEENNALDSEKKTKSELTTICGRREECGEEEGGSQVRGRAGGVSILLTEENGR